MRNAPNGKLTQPSRIEQHFGLAAIIGIEHMRLRDEGVSDDWIRGWRATTVDGKNSACTGLVVHEKRRTPADISTAPDFD